MAKSGAQKAREYREKYPEKARAEFLRYKLSPKGVATVRACSRYPSARFRSLRGNAKSRNLECTLTLEQYTRLIAPNQCEYCQEPLSEAGGSLDRKDSSLGYTLMNCVPCCFRCNQIRGHDNVRYSEMPLVIHLIRLLRSDESVQPQIGLPQ
jgi:hypothetical protein